MWRALKHRAALLFLSISEFVLAVAGRRRAYGILKVEIAGDLVEDAGEQRLFGFLRRASADYLGVVTLLAWAREDPNLQGVLISCDDLRVSWARLQGLRRAIEKLRAAGKRVWVHLGHAGVGEYYVASAAERINLAPPVLLDITGLSSEAVFLLGALEKIGVQADVVQMGRYKSAGETFTRRDMSESHREMMESLVDDLYGQLIDAVAAGRALDPASARDLLDRGPFLGEEAVEAKLVDSRLYADQVEAGLVEQCHGATVLDQEAYSRRRGREVRRDVLRRSRGTFAVVSITGTIKSGDNIPGPEGASATGTESVGSALEELRDRDDVRAIVLRISSPGGSGVASDLMWREVVRTREKKPVVISCGDLAASGGYYVAVGGSPIFAEAGTITGSIGVIAGKANLRSLYDRIGVTKEMVTRGKHAAIHSDYVPLGDQERARIQAEAESFYRMFVDRVATSRRLSTEAVEAAAQGRVWTGRQALSRGLIDELGGIDDALDRAKTLSGIPAGEPVLVERHPRPRRLWKLSLDLPLPSWMHAPELISLPPMLRLLLSERVWTLLPFHFRFF